MMKQAKCQFVAFAFEDKNSFSKTIQMILDEWEEEKGIIEANLNTLNSELVSEFGYLYFETTSQYVPEAEHIIIPHKKSKRKLFGRKK